MKILKKTIKKYIHFWACSQTLGVTIVTIWFSFAAALEKLVSINNGLQDIFRGLQELFQIRRLLEMFCDLQKLVSDLQEQLHDLQKLYRELQKLFCMPRKVSFRLQTLYIVSRLHEWSMNRLVAKV